MTTDLTKLSHHDPEYDPDDDPNDLLPSYRPDAHTLDAGTLNRIADLEATIRSLQRKFRPNVAKALRELGAGDASNSLTALARKFKTTRTTLIKALDSHYGQQLYASQAHLTRALHGPQRAQRLAMAWRIAVHNEENAPRVALQALDYLSKISGDYVQTTESDSGVTVVVQQFNDTKLPPTVTRIQKVSAPETPSTPQSRPFQPITIDAEPQPDGADSDT